MPRTLNRASQVYPPGTYGPFVIDGLGQADDGFRLSFSRESWPDGAVAELTAEISVDSVSWQVWFRWGLTGGVFLDKQGQPVTTSQIVARWPGENDGNGGRKVMRQAAARLTVTVLQTFRTAITIEPV